MKTSLNIEYPVTKGIKKEQVLQALEDTMRSLNIEGYSITARSMGLNSQLNYFSVDDCGFKTWGSDVISGKLTEDQIEIIRSCLMEGEFFDPIAVGLSGLGSTFVGIHPEGFSLTNAEPTVSLTPDELVEKFLREKKLLKIQ